MAASCLVTPGSGVTARGDARRGIHAAHWQRSVREPTLASRCAVSDGSLLPSTTLLHPHLPRPSWLMGACPPRFSLVSARTMKCPDLIDVRVCCSPGGLGRTAHDVFGPL
eukprot:2716854-Rhodomonas_salina.1